MADIKLKYGAVDPVAVTIALANLASSSTLLAGRESTVIDNTTNLDLDHLVSAHFTTGSSPTAGTRIELWCYGLRKSSSSGATKVYPANFTGADAALTLASDNVKFAALRRIGFVIVDSTTNREYDIPPTSVAARFGGRLPPYYGLFAVHNNGVALQNNSANQDIQYLRVLAQA